MFRWVLKFKNGLYRQDSNLLSALASMYDESKDHFVIGNPKMDIDFGLEDVLYITGLPTDAEHVSGYESQNIKGTIMEHFKINEEKAESLMMNSGNSIDLSRLKFEFEMVPQEEDIDLEPYFKAYLLFLLGEFIHPNNSCSYSPMYLPLLGLNVVNHYAWGAAMLANMKESIEKVKKVGKFTSLCGFSYALTVFALERFPFLRERCGSSPLYSLPSGFPLILGWMEALCKPNKDTKNVKSVGYYKKKLQDMEEKDILDKKVINVDEEKPQSSMVVEQAVELPAGLLEDICYPSRNDPNFVNVHCKDLECLAPQKFLRSPVMDFYIRNWWKSSDIFRKAYIFIPIHEDLHWSLVIICIHDKEDESGLTILHLDSLRFHSRRRIVENVKSFLEYEWNYVKQGDYSLDLPVSKQIWETFLHSINNVDIEVPQQKNDFDCGVFVLFFIKRFIEVAPQRLKKKDLGMFNKNWFRPDEASALRIKIQNTLIDLFRVGDNLLQEPIKVYGRKRKKQSKGIVDNVPVALDRLVGNTPVALRTQNQLANVGRSQYGRLYVQPDCFTPATYKK
ncbi:uncharacterized protein LOC106396553 isoform X2 [Brassica napus]|nr:uncharacterized protein LOC106396553 isoform X2 [Brassica napus]